MAQSDDGAYQHIGLVKITLHAELGRCAMRFSDISRLQPGALVTLDRLAGEPVEVRCRGQCVARGEVVIQDDAFAIRVTEILDRRDNAVVNATRRNRHRKK